MLVTGSLNPFNQNSFGLEVEFGCTLFEVVKRALAKLALTQGVHISSFDWFYKVGKVVLGDHVIEPHLWKQCKAKSPKAHIQLCAPAPGKGKVGRILLIVAAVALVVVTGFIAAGGLFAVFGIGTAATLGAGSLGASLLAGAIGLAGQLAIKALSPKPPEPEQREGPRDTQLAGIQGNALARGEYIASVIGEIEVSPQVVYPYYTDLIDENKSVIKVMVGLAGRYKVEDVKINGILASQMPDVVFEVKEANAGDTFLSNDFTLQDRSTTSFSSHDWLNSEQTPGYLKDQVTPENSLPKWHRLKNWKEMADTYEARIQFPSGITSAITTLPQAAPIAMRIRRVGTTAWRLLPVFHFRDSKGNGPLEQNIKLLRTTGNRDRYVARNKHIPAWLAYNLIVEQGNNRTYSDDYFRQFGSPANHLPGPMSAYSQNGYTVSASSEFAGHPAYLAVSGSSAGWRPAANSLPAWIKVDLGTPKKILSYYTQLSGFGNDPANWGTLELHGSTNDVVWTKIGSATQDLSETSLLRAVENPGLYRYFRVTYLTNLGAANGDLRIGHLRLFENYLPATMVNDVYTSSLKTISNVTPHQPSNPNAGPHLALHVNSTPAGFSVYLDPQEWPVDEYEVEVKKGLSFSSDYLGLDSGAGMDCSRYFYDDDNGPTFFHYWLSTPYRAFGNPSDLQSSANVVAVSQHFPFRPIRADKENEMTRIAVQAQGITINSLSATFTNYAKPYLGGGVWGAEIPTRNPAASARQALLDVKCNLAALPEEVLDEEDFVAFWEHCEQNGFTADAVISSRSVGEVFSIACSTARASRVMAPTWGITIDHDRSAEAPVALLTPTNSQDKGTEISFPVVPEALRVSYMDRSDSHKLKETIVYAPGFNQTNAVNIEAIPPYVGITDKARAEAQAKYDIGQIIHRRITRKREVPLYGMLFRRGDLVEVADDVISSDHYHGLIRDIIYNDGATTVLGFYVYGQMTVGDDAQIQNNTPMVCVVKARHGSNLVIPVQTVEKTEKILFVTPVPNTGQFEEGYPIAVGVQGLSTKRMIVKERTHVEGDLFEVTLLPEGNEIFEDL